MKHHPEKHRCGSVRLPGYDYTRAGACFIPGVGRERRCLFGAVVDGQMQMNETGCVALRGWVEIPVHFSPRNWIPLL